MIWSVRGCVLSPVLYSMDSNDCVSQSESVTTFKFADDATIIALITDNDETDYRQELSTLDGWSRIHYLKLM